MTGSLRKATPRDYASLEEIERASFQSGHWIAADFRSHDCTVVEFEGRVIGFLVTQKVYSGNDSSLPELEILNLAVLPEFRRLGIASALLNKALARPGVFFLEVRESNEPAVRLYERFGFREVARRPNYYDEPDESAIVMRAERC